MSNYIVRGRNRDTDEVVYESDTFELISARELADALAARFPQDAYEIVEVSRVL